MVENGVRRVTEVQGVRKIRIPLSWRKSTITKDDDCGDFSVELEHADIQRAGRIERFLPKLRGIYYDTDEASADAPADAV